MASGDSTEVAAGYVSLYARMDAGQLVSEVTNALSGLNAASLASGVLNDIGSAASTLGTRLTVLGAAAAIGASKLTGGLFDTISTAENASIAFETMRGSADLAAESMERLNEFAIKTPYEFSNIATSSRQLMAMGIDFDRQLDESGNGILKWAGNWASALGLNDAGFSNVLTQMGHISAAGRIYTRNITTLSRNGIAAWQALSDYMGISIDEVRDKVQKGEVDAETAFAAFEKYANEHFVGTMDRMAHTMTGVMSNMGDAIKVPIMALSNTSAYAGLTSAMYDLTDPMRELTTALMPTVEALFERATPLVKGFTDRVAEMADALKRGNPNDLVYGLEALAMVLGSGPMLKGFGALSKGLGGFLGTASGLGKGIVNSVFSPLSALAKVDLRAVAGGVKGFFGTLRGALPNVSAPLLTVADKLGEFAGKATTAVTPMFRNMARSVGFGFDQFLGQLSLRLLEDIWSVKAAFHQNTSWVLKDISGLFGNFFTNMFRLKSIDPTVGTKVIFAKLYEFYYWNFKKLFSDTGKLIGETLKAVGGAYGEIFSVMATKISGAVKGAFSKLPALLNAVKSALPGILNTVKRLAKPFEVLFGKTLKTGVAAFSKFSGLMIKGGSAFGIVALGATLAAGAFAAMGGSLPALGAEIADVLGSVGGTAADALGGFADALTSMVANGDISSFFMSLTSGINGFVSQVGGQLPAAISAIGAAFPQFVNGLVGMFATYAPMLATGAMRLFSGLVTGLTMVIQQLTPQLPTIIGGLASAIATNIPAIAAAGVALFGALVEAFAVTVPTVIAQLPMLIDSLVSTLAANFPAVMDGATNLFNAIADAIPVIVPMAIGALGSLLSTLIGTFPSWGPGFLTAMGNVLLSIVKAISNAIPKVVSAIKSLLTSAANAIKSVNWSSLGSNLIKGFISGVKAMASSVVNAAVSVIKGATSAVTGFLRIGSPSKLFRWVGDMTMEGLALGIGDGAGGVMDAMGAVAKGMANTAVVPGAGGAFAPHGGPAGGGGGISQYFNTTVIRADDDLYAAAPILYRTAIYEAGLAL